VDFWRWTTDLVNASDSLTGAEIAYLRQRAAMFCAKHPCIVGNHAAPAFDTGSMRCLFSFRVASFLVAVPSCERAETIREKCGIPIALNAIAPYGQD